MSSGTRSNPGLSNAFHAVSSESQPLKAEKKDAPAPFSLRLSTSERAYLEELAGNQPLGAYIRDRLLGEKAHKRRRFRKPQINDEMAARFLAELGKSRYASNLNQLSKAVHTGTLDVSQDVEQEIREACESVQIMRDVLMQVFGVLPGREK
ncbi:hypothetical protein [Candidatus Thiodiazotropha sp. CDECU1]|uniref:hypothetical protein n=1 Tax=Candidatus Thiodiazotropha sp. CDECU1 TaxID=3065865 RepID=UPI00292DCF1B|nr:hypothetical protein [Candidatus Thiodiazotropha sp. CDECU1]